jgi:hypothetical protein
MGTWEISTDKRVIGVARQDAKEREKRDDVGAGRMTATARADTGALEARR